MKKNILILDADLSNSDVIYRTENGYGAGSQVDGITNPSIENPTNTGKNYLNKRQKYKEGSLSNNNLSDFERELLRNFAEYHAGYNFIITNTGLIAFYKSTDLRKLFIYDILEKENITLGDIDFDLSPFASYDEFVTPMNHFYVEYKTISGSTNLVFPIKQVYTQGNNTYCKAPVDYVSKVAPEDNGLFKTANTVINTLQYSFSQGISIKHIKPATTNLAITVSIKILKKDTSDYQTVTSFTISDSQPHLIDLSNYSDGEIIDISLSISSAASAENYGLLEVLC